MGNFSNDPNTELQNALNKGYCRVRFQQGKPVLDRELNLLSDLAGYQRFAEHYSGNGIPEGSNGFQIADIDAGANNFKITAGRCLVKGYELVLAEDTTYRTQPHSENATRIPRVKCYVWLRIFNSEISGKQDADLNNSGTGDVGFETALREKVEWEVRVTTDMIYNPDHMLLAEINTETGEVKDRRRTGLTLSSIRDELTLARGNTNQLNDRLDESLGEDGKLKRDSVGVAQITDNSVNSAKIADNAAVAAKIANNAVTSTKIADNAVTSAKIANNAITSAKIADNAVTSAKIIDNAITSAKIVDNAVTSAKITNNAITSAKIANNSITTGKIASNAVTSANIADGTIVNSDIAANAAIIAAKIAGDAGIQYRNIGSSTNIPTTVRNLGSIEMAVPASGFVVLIAAATAVIFGDKTTVEFGIGTTNSLFNINSVRVGFLDGSGELRRQLSATSIGVVPVSAGTRTYYCNAVKPAVFSAKQVNMSDIFLLGIFIPKRY